jgi:YVTN family beta-propeller protein
MSEGERRSYCRGIERVAHGRGRGQLTKSSFGLSCGTKTVKRPKILGLIVAKDVEVAVVGAHAEIGCFRGVPLTVQFVDFKVAATQGEAQRPLVRFMPRIAFDVHLAHRALRGVEGSPPQEILLQPQFISFEFGLQYASKPGANVVTNPVLLPFFAEVLYLRELHEMRLPSFRLNYRLVFLLALLAGLAAREIALELRPTFLRPGLHLFAYVGNTGDGTVTAIDLIKLAPVATVSVGAGPTGVRAHPTRKEIWGVSSGGGYLWILDPSSNQVVARIPLGVAPYALDFSPDGTHAFVAASNSVVAIDCASRQIVARGRAGHGAWIARVSPNGKLVVVSNREDASVSILDSTTLASLATIKVVPHPEQIAILPDSTKAFITSGTTDQISVVDLKRKVLLANLALGGTPEELILKPDGGELFIPSSGAHGLLVVNTETNEVADFRLLGMSPGRAALDAKSGVLYVSDSAGNDVVPISIDTRQVARPIPVGQAPGRCHLTPLGDALLVVDTASNDLAVIRTRTAQPAGNALAPPQSPITLIPTGPKPRDLAVKVF